MVDILGKTFYFDAAHRLLNHDGKCRNLHGHTYRVDVEVQGDINHEHGAADQGMVLDFDSFKSWWRILEAQLDHTALLWVEDPLTDLLAELPEGATTRMTVLSEPPTAENIAEMIYEDLEKWLVDHGQGRVEAWSVRVWETPTSWAERT